MVRMRQQWSGDDHTCPGMHGLPRVTPIVPSLYCNILLWSAPPGSWQLVAALAWDRKGVAECAHFSGHVRDRLSDRCTRPTANHWRPLASAAVRKPGSRGRPTASEVPTAARRAECARSSRASTQSRHHPDRHPSRVERHNTEMPKPPPQFLVPAYTGRVDDRAPAPESPAHRT